MEGSSSSDSQLKSVLLVNTPTTSIEPTEDSSVGTDSSGNLTESNEMKKEHLTPDSSMSSFEKQNPSRIIKLKAVEKETSNIQGVMKNLFNLINEVQQLPDDDEDEDLELYVPDKTLITHRNYSLSEEEDNDYSLKKFVQLSSEILEDAKVMKRKVENPEKKVEDLCSKIESWRQNLVLFEKKSGLETSAQGLEAHSSSSTSAPAKETTDLSSRLIELQGSLDSSNKEKSELQTQVRKMDGTIKELNEMNLQWQKYTENVRKTMKQQSDDAEKKLKEKITNLESQLNKYRVLNSTGGIDFSDAQKEVVDCKLQRFLNDVSTLRDERDVAQREADERVSAANARKNEAETKLTESQAKVSELEALKTNLLQQVEELQTALLVATRNRVQQSPVDPEQLHHLREEVRRYQDSYSKAIGDYQRAIQENTKLTERLRKNVLENRNHAANRAARRGQSPQIASRHASEHERQEEVSGPEEFGVLSSHLSASSSGSSIPPSTEDVTDSR